MSILESGYGILQYFELDPFHPGGYRSYESNLIGTFGSENAMGGFLAAGFPLAFYQLYAGNKGLRKYFIAVGTGLMLVALALTISRGAWIAVIIAALFLAFPGIKRIAGSIDLNKILKIGIVILILIVGFLLLLGVYNINAASSSGRIFIWKISLGMLAENPLIGIGYGNYGYQYLNYQAKFFSHLDNLIYRHKAVGLKGAHSEIIHVMAETGILGFIVFISIFGLLFYYAYNVLNRVKSDKNRHLLIRCISASMLIISIHAVVDNVLHVLPIALIFYWGLAVISTAMQREISNGGSILNRLLVNFRFKGNVILPELGIVLLVINVYRIVRKSRGYIYWKSGQDAVHQGAWNNGISQYKQALKYLPDNGELQFHLGAAYSYIGEADKAIDLLNKSLEKFSDKNIYLTLGHAYKISGNYNQAEDCFKTVTQMYPQMLLPHLWLAMLYHEMGNTDASVEELRYIINSKPEVVSKDVLTIQKDARKLLNSIENQ